MFDIFYISSSKTSTLESYWIFYFLGPNAVSEKKRREKAFAVNYWKLLHVQSNLSLSLWPRRMFCLVTHFSVCQQLWSPHSCFIIVTIILVIILILKKQLKTCAWNDEQVRDRVKLGGGIAHVMAPVRHAGTSINHHARVFKQK